MRALLLAAALTMACSAESLSLSQTVQKALENYPSIRVSERTTGRGMRRVFILRAPRSYPRADVLGQINRATRNNTFRINASASRDSEHLGAGARDE